MLSSEIDTLFVDPEPVDTINMLKPRLNGVRNHIILEGSVDNMIDYQHLLNSDPDHEPDITVYENDQTPAPLLYAPRYFLPHNK